MKSPRTIDCHTHILTEEAMRLLAKQSPKVAPVLKNQDARGGTLENNELSPSAIVGCAKSASARVE